METSRNPVSRAPRVRASRVKPREGTCFRAAERIVVCELVYSCGGGSGWWREW